MIMMMRALPFLRLLIFSFLISLLSCQIESKEVLEASEVSKEKQMNHFSDSSRPFLKSIYFKNSKEEKLSSMDFQQDDNGNISKVDYSFQNSGKESINYQILFFYHENNLTGYRIEDLNNADLCFDCCGKVGSNSFDGRFKSSGCDNTICFTTYDTKDLVNITALKNGLEGVEASLQVRNEYDNCSFLNRSIFNQNGFEVEVNSHSPYRYYKLENPFTSHNIYSVATCIDLLSRTNERVFESNPQLACFSLIMLSGRRMLEKMQFNVMPIRAENQNLGFIKLNMDLLKSCKTGGYFYPLIYKVSIEESDSLISVNQGEEDLYCNFEYNY